MTVLGQGIIELSADGSKLNAAIADARKSIDGLGKSSGQATKAASQSIDRYIQSLETQAKTIGKSTREQIAYKLALRGASDEQLRAADNAQRLIEAHREGANVGDQLRTGFIALGAAAVASLGALAYAFDSLVKKTGDFQDLAESIGDTSENVASLAVAAGTAGISMESVAGLSQKLTKNLSGVDDESKSAGAALTALGIDIAEFKKLNPTDQLETVAKAMDKFEDSSTKSAVAMALFGKSGADAIPFMKELAAEGGRQNILTADQIRLADEYADRQAKFRTEIGLQAQVIASDLIPTINAFTDAIMEIAQDQEFVATATAFLKGAITGLVEIFKVVTIVGSDVIFVFTSIGREIGAIGAQLVALATLDMEGFSAIGDAVKKDAAEARAELDRFQAKVMAIGTASAKMVDQVKEKSEFKRPALKFTGAVKKGEEEKEAKAALDRQLASIKAAAEREIAANAAKEKELEAVRSAGFISEQSYYQQKRNLLESNANIQKNAIYEELKALNALDLKGAAKDENDKKIIETQAKLSKLYLETASSLNVLSIQMGSMTENANFADAMAIGIDNFKLSLINLSAEASKAVESAMSSAVDGISKSISQAIVYGKDLEQSLTDVALNIADAFIAAFIKMQIQKLLLDKTAAAGYAAAMAAESEAMVAMAGLNAYASTSAIPIVGPAAAPAAAAAAIAAAQGFAASVIAASAASVGARELGGPVSAGGMYRVNEKGPELLTVGGKDFLMMGQNAGMVTPNNKLGAQIIDNTVINIDSRADRVQIMRDVSKMIESGHARLTDRLQRKGQL